MATLTEVNYDPFADANLTPVEGDPFAIPQGDAGGMARAAAYGVSGGQVPFGNVITSGIGAGIAKAFSPFTGDERTYSELYDQAQADTKATQDANPGSTLAGNIAGIASTLPLTMAGSLGKTAPAAETGLRGFANAAPQAAAKVSNFIRGGEIAQDASALSKLGQVALRGVKSGAVSAPVGALYGAGEADAGQRGEGAATGAAISGGLGFAAPFAGSALKSIGGKIVSKMNQSNLEKLVQERGEQVYDIPDKAMNKIIARLKADYPDEEQLKTVLNDYATGNKSLVELAGDRTLNLAKGSAQYPSGEAVAKDYIYNKVEGTPTRVKETIARNISPDTNYYDTLDNIVEKGREKAAPLYAEAYAKNPSVASREIDNILSTPAGKKALSGARTIMQNDRSLMALPDKELGELTRDLASMGKMAETEGGVASGLNMRSLDYVKKSLDDQYRVAVRNGETSNANSILGLKQSLVREMDNADVTARAGANSFKAEGGAYSRARKSAGDYLSNEKAMQDGLNFEKYDSQELGRMMGELGETERASFRNGVVKSIRDRVDNSNDGANLYNRIFNKQEQRARLQQILTPEQFQRISNDLETEKKLYQIRDNVLGGSPTAGKQIAAQEFEDHMGGVASDVARKGITGAALDRATGFILQRFDGLSDKTANEVARALYETDPQKKLDIINKIYTLTPVKEAKPAIEAFFNLNKNVPTAPLRVTVPPKKAP